MYEIKITEDNIGVFEAESLKANCVLEDLSDIFMQNMTSEEWSLHYIERDRIYWKLQIIDDALARILAEIQKITKVQ